MKKTILILLLLSADFAFGQQTASIPVTVDFPQIAIGGDSADANYVTLLQIVNNNSIATTGHLALYTNDGSALAALIDGQGPQTTMDISLAPGQARQIQLTASGPITSGWMEITYSPSDALTTVILQFRTGATLRSEIGIQPEDTISAADLAVETDASLNTGIAIANPDTVAAAVFVTLWDPNTGTPLSGVALSLPPHGHVARFLTELFPAVNNIGQMRAKLSLDGCSDTSCNFAGGSFVATAVRLNGDQFTTIPVAGDTGTGDQVRILPQVAFGGPVSGLNMRTVLYFTTNVSSGVFGTAEIFDNDGNPLAASADDAAPSSSIRFTVNGNRVNRLVLSGDETLRSGWIRLTLSGSVHFIASAVFQTFDGPNLVSEASVLESAPISQGLLYVNTQSSLSNVGVAFANSQTTPNTITLQLFAGQGGTPDTQTVTLPPNGHLAQFVTEIFPQLASLENFDGALSLQSSTPFSALALRLSSTQIATLPVASDGMYRPAIAALRITRAQRNPAQVNFQIDVADLDSDTATSSSTAVSAIAGLDFGDGNGPDAGIISLDGAPVLNRSSGTLTGSFQPPGITNIPSGTQAYFLVVVYDSAHNQSNVIYTLIKF
jgi:hypothetical protein